MNLPAPIGQHRDGRPIWPIAGGDGTEGEGTPPAEPPAAPTGTDPPAPAATQGATPSPALGLAISPDLARATPEFRAQAEATRSSAREVGALRAENERLRKEAEASRAAAEAAAIEAQAAELRGALGDEGYAEYVRIAELSQTDPVGAAKAMVNLSTRVKSAQPPAQAPVPMAPGAATTGATNTGGDMSFGTRGVQASAPLGAPGNDPLSVLDQIGNEAQSVFEEDVKRVQSRDSRWNGRDFTRAVANLVQGSYARRFAEKAREEAGQGPFAGLLRRR